LSTRAPKKPLSLRESGTDADIQTLNARIAPYVVSRLAGGPLGTMFRVKGPGLDCSCGGGRDAWISVKVRAHEAANIYRLGRESALPQPAEAIAAGSPTPPTPSQPSPANVEFSEANRRGRMGGRT
jgi:hypothetical protein